MSLPALEAILPLFEYSYIWGRQVYIASIWEVKWICITHADKIQKAVCNLKIDRSCHMTLEIWILKPGEKIRLAWQFLSV